MQIECGAQFSVALTATGQVKQYLKKLFNKLMYTFMVVTHLHFSNYYFLNVRYGLGVKVNTTD